MVSGPVVPRRDWRLMSHCLLLSTVARCLAGLAGLAFDTMQMTRRTVASHQSALSLPEFLSMNLRPSVWFEARGLRLARDSDLSDISPEPRTANLAPH